MCISILTLRRPVAVLLTVVALVAASQGSSARSPLPVLDKHITYILPLWPEFLFASDEEVTKQVERLRQVGNDGPRVRLGFTTFISIEMLPLDPTDTTAIRAAVAGMAVPIDRTIAKARTHNIALNLSFLTATRSRVDAAQTAYQNADRRSMQWLSDNSLGLGGWVTHSQYARNLRALEEAYIRELGRLLASRFALYPETLVSATGDGEVELSFDGQDPANPLNSRLADFSPFAVAEFRDWLRGTGMYAAGQPLAGGAYPNSARYAGSDGLANMKADFGVDFDTWNLKHFHWELSDLPTNDPRALPASTYLAPGWNSMAVDNPKGFDAPRQLRPQDPYWKVWHEFRQLLLWRWNRNFAKWITTSPDLSTGNTVPPERWFSDQIAADRIFGHTPDTPPDVNLRWYTSASAHWTADVSPYGSLGITSYGTWQFNTDFNVRFDFPTLKSVGPFIVQRKVRWGILEWNPFVPALADPEAYRAEMALVLKYRPSLLVPFMWGAQPPPYDIYKVLDTDFEVTLKELIAKLRLQPLNVDRSAIVLNGTTDGKNQTPAQRVRVSTDVGTVPSWFIQAQPSWVTVTPAADNSFTVALTGTPPGSGQFTGTIVVSPNSPDVAPVSVAVTATLSAPTATLPPRGAFETPTPNEVVFGEKAVTGWALDDVGVAGVDIFRSPVAGETPGPFGLVFIGAATLVTGSRPDVAAQFPNEPQAESAGWGYMLLTNFLPNQGTGTFTLWAIARDVEGKTTTLGSRTILAQNATATLPFGTIDTPGQGETVSGTILNWGWALSPGNTFVPFDGSTINVFIDGVPVGKPREFGLPRSDIDGLFPGLQNTGRAVGYYILDTRTLTNGVHTIAWSVTNNLGQTQGIGSRYFTVANP